jgi:hypothetical protein
MEPKTMSKLFPEDDFDRFGSLVKSLTKTYRALAEQENFTPQDMLLAVANAASHFAVNHGFSSPDYFKLQKVLILELAARKEETRL